VSRANWNQPLDVRESKEEVFWDGQRYAARIDWHLLPEDIEMIREGRKCVNCMEVFKTGDGLSVAWPTVCPVCNFPVAQRQAEVLNQEYMGEVRVGPTSSDTDEIDRMEYERASGLWTPGSSIAVPRGPGGS
jgi:hypothetical protein